MSIQITPIPAFNDNYIWLLHNEKHAVAVDPGDAEPVNKFLADNNLQLIQILITHHHWDHVNGLEELQTMWSCEVFSPRDERVPGNLTHVDEGDLVYLPELDIKLSVLSTPGHTSTHICYYNDQWLFCGDTLFSMGCGRMFEGTPEQFNTSLEKLKKLSPDTQVYCTHEYTLSNIDFALSIEPNNKEMVVLKAEIRNKRQNNQPSLPTTMKRETQLNPFLRTEDASFRQLLSDIRKVNINDKVTCFAMLRRLKDHF